jgi:N-acetylglucosaminyldiphosphoundecaprenol N-acetyl-beta-D-mannosaminyltransferase
MMTNRVFIGGLPIDRLTREETLIAIDVLIRSGRGGYVVTPNVDHVVRANHDRRFREAYQRARVSVADGQPLLWMARALGTPLPEKVSGSDLIVPLMARAASSSWRVFFFGATPEVSAAAERRLARDFPGLQVVGRDCSFWSPDLGEESSATVRAIKDSRADLVIVALGSPKQELWMARHAEAIGPAVSIGLGASLDFVAGAVQRAPSWMSRAGLEWVFRLSQEPRRLAYRYLVRDLRILPIFWRDLVRLSAWRARPAVAARREA